MRKYILLASVVVMAVCCSCVQAYILTFEDIPSGDGLQYYSNHYGATFSDGFVATDHSGSTWGIPHSGTHVLIWSADPNHLAMLGFGNRGLDGSGNIDPYGISSITAYFSTDEGVEIKMLGYRNGLSSPVAEKNIGLPAELSQSWDNVYVELRADDGGAMDYIVFEGVISPNARLGFCADDVTIEPVPEPPPFFVLGAGLLSATSILAKERLARHSLRRCSRRE